MKPTLKEQVAAAAKNCEGLYRHTVWPDADKGNSAIDRDADLACMGFGVGWDAANEESPLLERAIEALRAITENVDDIESYDLAREALKEIEEARR